MSRKFAWLGLGAFALLALLWGAWTLQPPARIDPAPLDGKPLPAARVQPLAGGPTLPLAEAARGPVLINVFASWCLPCRAEHPELMRLKSRGVRIIGVAWKEKSDADSRAFLAELGDPYALVLSDPKGVLARKLKAAGAPQTFAVDSRGVIVGTWPAPMTRADADRLAARLGR